MLSATRSLLYSVGIVGSEQNAKKAITICVMTVSLLVFYYVCFFSPETSPILSDYYSSKKTKSVSDVLTDVTPTDRRLEGVFGAVLVSEVL